MVATGGGGGGEVTTFPGGTLDDLAAISPTLSFDELRITGTLTVPNDSMSEITANEVTIAGTGGIGPSACNSTTTTGSLAFTVSGDFVIEPGASALLVGGTQCPCNGTRAGGLTVTADAIIVRGVTVSTSGGFAGSDVGLGCNGGDAALLSLNARTIELDEATLSSQAGPGGVGSLEDGVDGAPGEVVLNASDSITMRRSMVTTDGPLTLSAARTDIFSPLNFGSLVENIGGTTNDVTAPTLTIETPEAGDEIDPSQPLEVVLVLKDEGVGVREGAFAGFGVGETSFTSQAIDPTTGLVVLTIEEPRPPATLVVAAIDNKGNFAEVPVPNLSFSGPPPPVTIQELEENGTFAEAQAVFVNSTVFASISAADEGSILSDQDPGDDIEDLFRFDAGSEPQNLRVELTSTNLDLAFDIDLYAITDNGANPPTVVASSVNPGTAEAVDVVVGAGQTVFIGVSQSSPTLFPDALTTRPYQLVITEN